jgi:hypothetical protein
MKAFRYLASHWIDTLRDRRFKLAKPSELNDPFDCAGAFTGKLPKKLRREKANKYLSSPFNDISKHLKRGERRKEERRQMKEIERCYSDRYSTLASEIFQSKSGVDQIIRMLCASLTGIHSTGEPPDNDPSEILMWSHYANCHKGLRIGIDTSALPRDLNVKGCLIQYSNERPVYDLSQGEDHASTPFAADLIRKKALPWSYEKEVRLLIQPVHCIHGKTDKQTPASFLPFPEDFIWRVDFGLAMPEEEQQSCMEILSQSYPHVAVYKARHHKTDYRIHYEPINTSKLPADTKFL